MNFSPTKTEIAVESLTVYWLSVEQSFHVWMGAKHKCFSHQNCEKQLMLHTHPKKTTENWFKKKIDLNMYILKNLYHLTIFFYPTYVGIGTKYMSFQIINFCLDRINVWECSYPSCQYNLLFHVPRFVLQSSEVVSSEERRWIKIFGGRN